MTHLNADLTGYIEENKGGFSFFRHPLFVTIYDKSMNGMINTIIEKRENLLNKTASLMNRLFIIERSFKLEYLVKNIFDFYLLTHDEKWEILEYIWTDSENPGINASIWELLFNETGNSPFKSTTAYLELSDEITLYRGGLVDGLSWSGNEEQAEWFSNRFSQGQYSPQVWMITVPKEQIYHYTNSRNEDEYIISTKYTKTAQRIK